MKNKILKNFALPVFFTALCFIFCKPPFSLPTTSENELLQIMPLSDMEEYDAIKDE